MLIRKNFRLNLIVSYIFVVLISLGFIAYFLGKNLEENSLQELESSLIKQANLIKPQITAESLRKEDFGYLDALVKALSQEIKCRLTIINNQGRVLADSEEPADKVLKMENHGNRPEIRAALGGDINKEIRYSSTLKIDMFYIAVPLKDKDEVIGVLRLALPLTSVQKMLWTIRKAIFLGLFFSLGLAFVLGSVFAAETIRPINRMINISRKFSQGDFNHRILLDSKDEIGELAATLNKMAQDIEDKIREVQKQNQHLSAILNSMIEGVIVVDKSGCVISINPAVEEIFSVSGKEVKGRDFLESIRNNDISEIVNSVLGNKELVSEELTLVWPVNRIFKVNASPVFEKNLISGCLVVIHDITEIRKLETMRRDFVANVSHELKTPLTSIKGFVETLLEGALEDKENSRNFLKIIEEHTERLNSLIDDLLSLSNLESKETVLDKKSFNLRQQLEDIISNLGAQLNKRNIEIRNELSPNLLVKADKDRLEQVFINLIDNAIKFNKEKGYIRIYSQEINDKIKVAVEDSGIGIPAKDIPRIFERFYRVDKARSRELGGTGLGLSIAKHIIELHGGSVGVESTEGLGSKFWFILPQ